MKIFKTLSRGISILLGLVVIGVIGFGLYMWSSLDCQSLSGCIFDTAANSILSAVNPIPESYGRTAGIPLSCGADEEQDGALCYPKCEAGFNGVGPVCWQEQCPNGFRDDGAFCAKPAPYGRGGGFPWKFGDSLDDSGMIKRCEATHGQGNCEKEGLIFYPVCKANFHAVGSNICSPNCPAGMTDIGVSCSKKSYPRTAGVPLHTCTDGYEQDGALCYPLCKPGFKGVGPVCWEE